MDIVFSLLVVLNGALEVSSVENDSSSSLDGFKSCQADGGEGSFK